MPHTDFPLRLVGFPPEKHVISNISSFRTALVTELAVAVTLVTWLSSPCPLVCKLSSLTKKPVLSSWKLSPRRLSATRHETGTQPQLWLLGVTVRKSPWFRRSEGKCRALINNWAGSWLIHCWLMTSCEWLSHAVVPGLSAVLRTNTCPAEQLCSHCSSVPWLGRTWEIPTDVEHLYC